jgi:hypothetical protein
MEKETDNQTENRPWLWKKGQSGNLNGRPKGKSLKEYTREYLATMTDDDRQEFLTGLNKIDIWKQAEGNPETVIDATIKSKTRQPTLEEIELDKEYNEKLKALILKNGTTNDNENTTNT